MLEATVHAMQGLGARPERIRAGIGPCIGAHSYEVGKTFRTEFLSEDEGNDVFFAPGRNETKFLFDLAGYISHRLRRLFLGSVECCGNDTMSEADKFFSYRRSVLAGDPDYGRNLSAITLGS